VPELPARVGARNPLATRQRSLKGHFEGDDIIDVTHDSDQPKEILVDFISSKDFDRYLVEQHFSIAVSTYQSGNMFLFGPGEEGQLRVRSVILERPMGMFYDGSSLFVGGLYQLHRFNNVLPNGVRHEGSDRLFVPHVAWATGEMDCHDVVVDRFSRVIFVNTLYSCLAAVSSTENFISIWKPPVISELQPEDRCHLNGLALRDGIVRYATAFAQTNKRHAWRENKVGAGVVWDIQSNRVVVGGLSMPHSPRWYGGRLWLLDSGSGSFGYVDFSTKKFQPLLNLPGYLRGLAFHGKYAVIGSSIPRNKSSIEDAQILQKLAQRSEEAYCGIIVVNLETGKVEHFVRMLGDVQEIYDIAVLPGVQAPDGVGMRDDRIKYVLKVGSEKSTGQ